MQIHELTPAPGSNKPSKRIGRGHGSGQGKTAGKGHKGQNARSGGGVRPGFEGGQFPIYRLHPKRGFKNPNHIEYEVINLAELEELFEAGAVVDAKVLQERGVMKKGDRPLKILADGDLTKALKITADKFSAAAKQKIEAVGGSCTVIEHPVYNEMERRAARKAAAAAEAKKD